MDAFLLVFWVAVITAFSFFGSFYARKYEKPDALIGLYVAFVLSSNIIAYKIVSFDFGFVSFFSTAATIVFSVTFILTDIVNERFGRAETQKMIFIAFFSQLAAAVFVWLAISLDAAPFWTDQEAFARILGFAPRIMLASIAGFLISENLDAYLFAWLKQATKGKHLWMRNAFSSIPAMALDTFIFVSIAFYGVQELFPLIAGVVAIKWLVGLMDIPFMYFNRWILFKE